MIKIIIFVDHINAILMCFRKMIMRYRLFVKAQSWRVLQQFLLVPALVLRIQINITNYMFDFIYFQIADLFDKFTNINVLFRSQKL